MNSKMALNNIKRKRTSNSNPSVVHEHIKYTKNNQFSLKKPPNPLNHVKLQQARRNLPIYLHRASILEKFASHRVIILVGETGSGKTTQLSQYLLEEYPSQKIAITQPRRVAAITVAQRVCEEVNKGPLGSTVGYCVRFDDVSSSTTKLKFMTDGMLLREALLSPTLAKYSTIILDEAHERTLQTDILFGVVKKALSARKDLRVVIMSATLDIALFQEFFKLSSPAVLRIPGRQHHVEIFYSDQTQPDYLDAALVSVLQIHLDQHQDNGSILVFLTGQEDIETLETLLQEYAKTLPVTALKLQVCSIFAAMPRDQQMAVFESPIDGIRKVILATNIAETSITINGIRYVVDTGLVKQRSYQASNGMELLLTTSISKSQAAQRAGRAGRERDGFCYRLFPEATFAKLEERATPDIQRVSLEVVVLQLKVMGIKDILNFEFIEQPSRNSIIKAMEKLYALGAFDQSGELSVLGRQMAGLPLDPMAAVMLIRACSFGCADEALSVVAMLSVEAIFYSPRNKKEVAAQARKKFIAFEGDQITLLNVYNGYAQCPTTQRKKWCHDHFINARAMTRVMNVRTQLLEYLIKMDLPIESKLPDIDPLRKCIVAGYFLNTAMRVPVDVNNGEKHERRGKSTFKRVCGTSEVVKIHPSSCLFLRNPPPKWIVYGELVYTTKQYIRSVIIVEKEWLIELAPTFFKKSSQ